MDDKLLGGGYLRSAQGVMGKKWSAITNGRD